MGWKGTFSRIQSTRLRGTSMISFTLKNDNLLLSEKVDIAIFDSYGQQPFYFRGQELKAGKSLRFDYDTVGWTWCQGDRIAILGKNDKIKEVWTLQMKEYAPGECPECHGTHRCGTCNGQGFVYPSGKVESFQTCPHCGGTGICPTCDVPYRTPKAGGGPTGLRPF